MLLARAMTALTLTLAGPAAHERHRPADLEAALRAASSKQHVLHGERSPPRTLCGPRLDLVAPLDR